MLQKNEDAVVCDFAETYGVLDLYGLPCETAATLAAGLRENSRIRMELTGARVTPELYIAAICADALNWLRWAQSTDARHNRNRPKSIAAALSEEKKKETDVESFATAEDFMAARAAFLVMEASENA